MPDPRLPPSNVLAEQALLGAILSNNKAFDLVGGLEAEHFVDPLNAEIYRAIQRRITRGLSVDVVTLGATSALEALCEEIDGGAVAYLNSLLASMIGISIAGDYALAIRDAALRRAEIEIGGEIVERAHGSSLTHGDGVHTAAWAIAEIERAAASSGGSQALSMRDAVNRALRQSEAAHRGDKGALGILTGIRSLDERWGGLHLGALDIIGARSGTGKTAFASQIARAVAGQGIPVGFFSLEVPASDFGMAQLASIAKISVDDLRAGRLDETRSRSLMLAQQVLAALPVEVVDQPGITLSEAIGKMRLLKKQSGVRLIIIDHRSKLGRDPGFERMTKLDWFAHITDALKRAAKLLGVPVLLLCQLIRRTDRAGEDPRPRMSDLEYAGEQDADNIALIYRPALHMQAPEKRLNETAEAHANAMARWYAERTSQARIADVLFVKRRFGEPGSVRLYFDGPTLTFLEPPPDPVDDAPPDDLWTRGG